MAARGLKSKIAINVAILLLLSALITDILIVVVVQNIMTRNQISQSRVTLERLGWLYFSARSKDGRQTITGLAPEEIFGQFNSRFSAIGLWDKGGSSLYNTNQAHLSWLSPHRIRDILEQNKTVYGDFGKTWSVFWWHSSETSVAVPVFLDGEPAGVVAAMVPLNPIFEQLRGYHQAIFLYIIINTCILTIVGLYRIFRLYLKPIDRIVKQADDFNENEDPFFAFRQEDNELNRLSLSLNRMLARISSDKKTLQETVASLETANRELQVAQKEIIRAEKLASVGRLAAGIAHEIGNPIGIVLGYLDLLKQNDLDDDEKSDFLQRTEAEVQRINSIIRQLLDLARTKEIKQQPVAMHAVIQDIAQVMRVQPLMADIRMELDLTAESDIVLGNEDQLRQIFLNLFLNAADAIKSGSGSTNGIIRVYTAAAAENGQNKTHIKITVADNGPGIPAHQLQNIFDPFYTTKEPGKGTGLGLAVSYMIAEGMGGSISAERLPGQGAEFSLLLRLAGSIE